MGQKRTRTIMLAESGWKRGGCWRKYGLDTSFGPAGTVAAVGDVFAPLQDGSVIAASDNSLSRLLDNGTIDPDYNPDGTLPIFSSSVPALTGGELFGTSLSGDTLTVGAVDLATAKVDTTFGKNGSTSTTVPFTVPAGDSVLGVRQPGCGGHARWRGRRRQQSAL